MLTNAEIADLTSTLEATLIHRCDIQRPGAPTTDADNQPIPGELADHLTNEPCYYAPMVKGTQGENVTDARSAIFDQYEVLVSLDADVTEGDQVTTVRNHLGATIGGPLDILHVVRRLTHKQLVLERIR